MSGFAFHAGAPAGAWTSDPTGLAFAGGRYRLFVQHGTDGARSRAMGWARLTSPDLIDWTWDGAVLPPTPEGWAYTGCVYATEPTMRAAVTRHTESAADARQYQALVASDDAGASWEVVAAPIGPSGRNCRDPFVFRWPAAGDWRMLVAEPCDWRDWHGEPASTLAVWRSDDGITWEAAGRIGPWMAAGIVWEVPQLLDFGTQQVLILSVTDLRDGTPRCSVLYWTGRFDGDSFEREAEARRVDHGPDFFAACVNTVDGWPDAGRMLVGWASNWRTAREMPWPDSGAGGPATLPRRLTLADRRLVQQPVAGAVPTFDLRPVGDRWRLILRRDDVELSLEATGDALAIHRRGGALLDWESGRTAFVGTIERVRVFEDAGLIEIFLEPQGLTITAFLPGIGAIGVDQMGSRNLKEHVHG